MFNFLRKISKNEAKELEHSLAQDGLEFDSQESAEKFFFAQRDKDLEDIDKLNINFPDLDLNFKAKSLQRLEIFYFKAFIDKTITIDIPQERMKELMTQYMRQVFVFNKIAEWMVFENFFAQGRYELGLVYAYGGTTTENYVWCLDKDENNKNRTCLFDKFMIFVSKEHENEVL